MEVTNKGHDHGSSTDRNPKLKRGCELPNFGVPLSYSQSYYHRGPWGAVPGPVMSSSITYKCGRRPWDTSRGVEPGPRSAKRSGRGGAREIKRNPCDVWGGRGQTPRPTPNEKRGVSLSILHLSVRYSQEQPRQNLRSLRRAQPSLTTFYFRHEEPRSLRGRKPPETGRRTEAGHDRSLEPLAKIDFKGAAFP